MIEISLLKLFLNSYNLKHYLQFINPETLSQESIKLLNGYKKFINCFNYCENINIDEFSEYFFNVLDPNMDDKTVNIYKEIFIKIKNCNSEEHIENLINSFKKQNSYLEISRLLNINEDPNIIIEKLQLINNNLVTSDKEIEMDISKAIINEDRSEGLNWKLPSLQKHFGGGLIKGDFGIIAGATDSGKTSFIASQISYMASKLTDNDYILWLNNEGSWGKIILRLYCSIFNCKYLDIKNNLNEYIKKYTEYMNGNKNRILIKDIQGWTKKRVEDYVKKFPPKLIIFDLLDHLKGFDFVTKQGEGNFERYNRLYQWARELSSQICPILAVSQVNREGAEQFMPDLDNLRGSGVDKQSAATFVLFIGSTKTNPNVKCLTTPKFKISGSKTWKQLVNFEPETCQFNE